MIDRMAQKFFPHLDPSKVDVSKVKTPFPSHGSALGAEVKISDCPDIENGEMIKDADGMRTDHSYLAILFKKCSRRSTFG